MIYSIGLTGTIASGKSTAALFFAQQNIPTLSADACARVLTQPNEASFIAIVEHFGASILTPEGYLNRRQLRQCILDDTTQRKWLEALLHPLIHATIKQSLQQASGPYCIIEIPLLTNRDNYPYLQRVLLMESRKKIQIERLMQRDRCSKADALKFLATQQHASIYRRIADDIVINTHGLDCLEEQLQKLHKHYLTLAASL